MNAPQSLDRFRTAADRVMVATLCALALATLAGAAYFDQWLPAVVVGLPACIVPWLVVRMAPGSLPARAAIACAFVLYPALMIHMSRGMIEMHFGIFVLLAFLLVYCDWRVIVLAAGLVAIHHVGANLLQAANFGIYVLPQAGGIGIIVLHAAFVVFEAAVLVHLSIVLERLVRGSAVVAEIAARVGEGDLGARVSAGGEDFEMLSSVTSMQQRLRQLIGDIKANSEHVLTASNSLAASSRELAGGTAVQHQSATSIAAAVEQLSVSVNHLNDNAAEFKSMVTASSRYAAEGGEVVKQSIEDMRSIEGAINEARAEIDRLGERSEAASRVVQIIDAIATQTNLLALNAAIEAARAGEAGRGFAVVSDEVRKLAERTQTSTSEIQGMMAAMVESRDALATRLTVLVQKVASGVANASLAGESIDRIRSDAGRVDAAVSQIAAALEEQSSAAGSISRHVDDIARLTEGTVSITGAVTRDVERLQGVSGALDEIVGRFRT